MKDRLKELGPHGVRRILYALGVAAFLSILAVPGCQGTTTCTQSSDCASGQVCTDAGVCTNACESNEQCGVSGACVSGACVDAQGAVGMHPAWVLLLIVFALIGAPLFAIFGAAAMILFGSTGTITSVAVDVFSERFADSPTLVTLPLFTFAGYLMAESGTPKRLVRVSRGLFGWLPGGLAVVCLIASAFFTTFTGGSGITIVAVGGLLFPALIAEKYPERFSLGLVTTGGSLGLLFPPSIPIVLYGVVAGILIDKLFLAGIVPGGITVALLSAYALVVGWRQRPPVEEMKRGFAMFLRFGGGYLVGAAGTTLLLVGLGMAFGLGAPEEPGVGPWLSANGRYLLLPVTLVAFFGGAFFTKGETRAALLEGSWEILLPNVLIAGLATGVLRIHEAAAFTALYVLIVEVFVYKDISLTKDLPRVIKDSMTMLGAILAILATALGFTGYLIQARVPELMVEWMETFISEPWMFLLALNLFLLVVGMLMDIFSAIVVVVPLIVPIARHFGIDPYHLGIIFLLNLEIGYLTPPVGLNLFIASFRFEKPVTRLYVAVLPFIAILVVALVLTTYWPGLSTWLTSFVDTQELTTDDIERMGDGAGEMEGGGLLLDDEDDEGGGTLDDLGDDDDDLPGLDGPGGEPTLDDLDDDLPGLDSAPAEGGGEDEEAPALGDDDEALDDEALDGL
ncbi:MAG: TRAP transporter large permease subunit [Sandaracinaceae bacterium]|nr:TRAP transporter large permease subunit [Sandaracinaceae bacterium]